MDLWGCSRQKVSNFGNLFSRGFLPWSSPEMHQDPSSPGEVLRPEIALNKLFWPFAVPYNAWMISPIHLKKLFLRLKTGPKVTFSPKTVLQGNFAALWGDWQTSPDSETTRYGQEMILPLIYSLGKWLLFPGAQTSMCTHQAHYVHKYWKFWVKIWPHFGCGRIFRPPVCLLGAHTGVRTTPKLTSGIDAKSLLISLRKSSYRKS